MYFVGIENYHVPEISEFGGFPLAGDLLWIKLFPWEGNSSQGNGDSTAEIIVFI